MLAEVPALEPDSASVEQLYFGNYFFSCAVDAANRSLAQKINNQIFRNQVLSEIKSPSLRILKVHVFLLPWVSQLEKQQLVFDMLS